MDKSIVFVQNFCTHYTKRTFELLARSYNITFLFFSNGGEWYWQLQHGIQVGNFNYEYLPGFFIGKFRLNILLPIHLLRKKYEVFISGIDGRFILPIVYLISRFKHKPFILWTGIWTRLKTPFHRIFFPILHYLYLHSDAIVTYGDHVNKYLISEGVSENKIFSANHALENEIYSRCILPEEKESLLLELNICEYHKVILFLGRFEEIKGIPDLLDAFARLNCQDKILILAGTGSQEAALKEKVNELGISDQVRFPGYIPIDKTILYYLISYIFVLPSITLSSGKELWGLVINEAFNQGIPVVVTDAVGAAAGGLVVDGFNGFIVPEHDTTKMMLAMNRLIDEPDLREIMGTNARNCVKNWTQEKMIEGFIRAIDYVSKN